MTKAGLNGGSIIITVDLEDWFQVENLRGVYPLDGWDRCDIRFDLATKVLLDIFDHYRVRATFFVLGWVAERCPGLVRDISLRGHEVASHGYSHRLLFDLSQKEIKEELRASKHLIEDITGTPVWGFRAPGFSITEELLCLLAETGYTYDSSYNGIAFNKRCGKVNGWQTEQNGLLAKSGIVEFFIRNLRVGPFTIPWGGGGYFRLLPPGLFARGVDHILSEDGQYVFYIHPWELDSVQPRTKGIGMLNSFRHYLHLSDMFHRMNYFLSVFRDCHFTGCYEYLHPTEAVQGPKFKAQG